MHPRSLPSVDALLAHPQALALRERFARPLLVEAVRRVLDDARRAARDGERFGAKRSDAAARATDEASPDAILRRAEAWLDAAAAGRLPRVINATGVVLHTNLGRAPLGPRVVDAIAAAAADPVALEFDLASGERGERDRHVQDALCALTGAEAALVVNNNAAALLLALDTLAARREVVVSRGELIEIGGSFRLPDVLRKSGAILREVGTTNRTRLEDYAAAINRRTALVLRAHPSNYRITGFTEQPKLRDLAALAHERGVALIEDLGSGALLDLEAFGLPHEPTPRESLAAGADLVSFSGDKLLGGPQAGILVGRASLIEKLQRNPLKRALRVDKLTLAGLAATLALYRAAPDLSSELPVLALLRRDPATLQRLAHEACARLRAALPAGFSCEVVASQAEVGSGAQPTLALPSYAVAVTHESWSEERVARWFRDAKPAIVGRITRGQVLLDVRAVRDPADLVPHHEQVSA
ncbi:MAG TPA: L-seryl-tRNA(Sec) selenium transferase [Candidatus Binatia bacterium]